ncbi:MAG: leucine-rich repeat domain-containing protein, partial [Flavobacterium stagni]
MKRLSTLVALLVLSVNAFAEVSNSEKKALLELNKSTNGAQWTNKWDVTKPVANWYGVKVENDKVVAIDLSDNNLSGTLSAKLGDLKNLQSLVLFKNSIEGVIPATLGQLKNLQVLNLSFNKMSGEIPAEISGAVSLKELTLFMNNLTGTIPASIGKLTQLQ